MKNKIATVETATAVIREEIAGLQAKNRVVKAIRVGVASAMHHQKFTTRVVAAVRAALALEYGSEDPTEFCVSLNGYSFGNLIVWGGPTKLTYDTAVRLAWHNLRNGVEVPWVEGITHELDRADGTDYIEHLESQISALPRLVELERQAQALKAEAAQLGAALPEPKSATVREGSVWWSCFSGHTTKSFPGLFS